MKTFIVIALISFATLAQSQVTRCEKDIMSPGGKGTICTTKPY